MTNLSTKQINLSLMLNSASIAQIIEQNNESRYYGYRSTQSGCSPSEQRGDI